MKYAEGYQVFVVPLVCSSICMFVYFFFCPINGIYVLSFSFKILKWRYFSKHSSESSHIWVMGILKGLLPFHKLWPQGGAGGQNLGLVKKVLYCFSFYTKP